MSKKNINQENWDFNQEYQGRDLDSIEGARVFHQKFGHGKIISLDGDKAEVNFDKSSQKKIFIKYLQFMF